MTFFLSLCVPMFVDCISVDPVADPKSETMGLRPSVKCSAPCMWSILSLSLRENNFCLNEILDPLLRRPVLLSTRLDC